MKLLAYIQTFHTHLFVSFTKVKVKWGCSSAHPGEPPVPPKANTSGKKTATCGCWSVCFSAPLASKVDDQRQEHTETRQYSSHTHPPPTHTAALPPPPLQSASISTSGWTCLWMQTPHHVTEKVVQLFAFDVAIVCKFTEDTTHLHFKLAARDFTMNLVWVAGKQFSQR